MGNKNVDKSARSARLQIDLETLTSLRNCSSIFEFESLGRPPDRYTLTFRGRGVARTLRSASDVQWIDAHQIDMRLPYAYPQLPPDLRWVTPILHPNVSFSGFLQLDDLGLPWDESVTLDAVCERLWDVARLAFVNLPQATNFAAKSWLEDPGHLPLPVDRRLLRDSLPPSGVNVIRYQRRGVRPRQAAPPADDILYIGEDTPAPPSPRTRQRRDDDDILFIGDD